MDKLLTPFQERTIGKHRTSVRLHEYSKEVITRYCSTDIVSFDDKWITLDHGGYMTATTKRRMNQVAEAFDLGFKVYQKDYEWFVTIITYKRIYDAFGSLDMTKSPVKVDNTFRISNVGHITFSRSAPIYIL